ncbi:Cysteine and histidine-rich domain-containing protein [Psilocybe cubensis]|uniref:Chord-domain-containing protein n=2 Tax=Psilocybe cubensis TaxID=181762 RepID=A0A8H7Y4Z1_PSICU|nr:Cysteine and histidine-rich domain-containing protein [Psilocybe cubensis]KAH9484143.1 Cysteine and histidine-rich domain-containing protein [Psilocybe cubensis]
MARCTRKGCGVEFKEGEASTCNYHPGTPVFHEGLKSWSCCQDINKPVLDFDEFMTIPPCTEIQGHTSKVEAPISPAPVPRSTVNVSSETTSDGKEIYQVGGVHKDSLTSSASAKQEVTAAMPAPPPVPVLEVDDLNQAVPVGTPCKRKGCHTIFVSDEQNRQGDGEGTICRYHPLPPYFREGSKGYLCCKRRVLEFDEFLKIEGCQTGRHCFIPVVTEPKASIHSYHTTEEQVTCRIDHYQTPSQVHVSIFAKQVDKERSTVTFEDNKAMLDLFLPNNRRFTRTLDLFGGIDPRSCTSKVLGTKVELTLQKIDARSWTVLEKTDRDLGPISLTFGVGGRTGTVGGKEIILDESNKLRT